MERITKKEKGQVYIPAPPLPIPLQWCRKKDQQYYMNYAMEMSAMVEKLAAYEDETEEKCKPLNDILIKAKFPYNHLKDVKKAEWEKLDCLMETFDKEGKEYNLEEMPLLALVLRELLSTPIIRERHNMMCMYVPSWLGGPKWKKLLLEYDLKNIRLKDG